MQSTGTVQGHDTVALAIKGISHIATLPEITLKIIHLVEDPNSTAQHLHSLISNDPALCSRILKVVNSAFYGLPRQIGSINRAIVLLGLNAVKNIAIAASLTKLFRGGEISRHFSARDLWVHSISTAACSKIISDELSLGLPDEAFLAGLIHDIGIMVELQVDRNKLIQVFEELKMTPDGVPGEEMRSAEERIFGADHQAFGAALCDSWKFPKSFSYVAGHHHDPMSLPSQVRVLASVVYVAERLVAQWANGFRADITDLTISPQILDSIMLTPSQIAKIAEMLPQALCDVEETLGSTS
jgi:putative nucleotidyltransferase with HDIG domain